MRYPDETCSRVSTRGLDCAVIFGFLKQRRRRCLQAQPFPKEWLVTIEGNVLFFRRRAAEEAVGLLGHTEAVVAEKPALGWRGLDVAGEVRTALPAEG